ncbi:MAG TPA: zinc-ribbon domain-containing protein [Kofleriaceae bacterium]|jgi:hypothetical protein
MRCPACNTENTPDSRFCGGCGAKLAVAEPRVAPTAKIPDDAPFPAPASYATAAPNAYGNGPVSYAPPSMPPHVIPPTPSPVATPPPQIARVPEASLSIPTARPRTGLIATILAIDLALAGSGGWLLAQGLAAPHAVDHAPAPTTSVAPTQTSTAPSSPPAPPPSAIGSAGSATLVAIGSADAGSGSASPPRLIPPTPSLHATTPVAPVRRPSGPEDPYDADHLLDNEVDYAATRAAPEFERCLEAALREAPVHGAIRISFMVALDGHVDHARPAQNTTGSASLAGCLVAAISTWHFENHPAHPTSFVRPFSYP